MMRDPDGDARFGRTPYKGEMPSVSVAPPGVESFKPMSSDDQLAAAAFLASQGDGAEAGKKPPRDAARVARGKEIVTTRCTTCHLVDGKGDDSDQGLAPELQGWGSVAWTRAQIASPSSKTTYREHALDEARKGHMPRFDAELRPEDIDLLARWVVSQARASTPP
jgi:mono/diheme cytochrome c family protein